MAAILGQLFVVSTPIGNLQDLSPRALSVLQNSPIILAEDTRRLKGLLSAFQIHTPKKLISCHSHNETERIKEVLEYLEGGQSVALTTDAGSPGVSDPGGLMVEACGEAGFKVEVIPGPAAVIAALMGSGLMTQRYAFLGFLPKTKRKERESWVKQAHALGLALVLYESPNRIKETLEELHHWLGQKRVVVARELTKLHETFHRGVLGGLLVPELVCLGEMVIVVEAGEPHAPLQKVPLEARMGELLQDTSLKPKEKAKILALEYGLSAQDAYERMVVKKS